MSSWEDFNEPHRVAHVLDRRSCFGGAAVSACLFVLHSASFLTRNFALRFYCLLSSEHLIFVLLFFPLFRIEPNFPMTKTDTFVLRSGSFFYSSIEMMAFFTKPSVKLSTLSGSRYIYISSTLNWNP